MLGIRSLSDTELENRFVTLTTSSTGQLLPKGMGHNSVSQVVDELIRRNRLVEEEPEDTSLHGSPSDFGKI